MRNINPTGIKTSWRRRKDVSLYVPVMLQIGTKWNTQRRLDGTSPRRLSGTSPRCPTGTLKRLVKKMQQWCPISTPQKSLKWNTQRRLSRTYPRHFLQVLNKTPKNDVVIRLHYVSEWHFCDLSLVCLYYTFKFLCQNLLLVGF